MTDKQEEVKEEEQSLLDKDKTGADIQDEDNEPGCCFFYGQCILKVIRSICALFKAIYDFIAECLNICWYPTKERCADCCNNCGDRLRPHEDPAYSGF